MANCTVTTYYNDPKFEAASSFCYELADTVRWATINAPAIVSILAAAPFNFAGDIIEELTPVRSRTETIIK